MSGTRDIAKALEDNRTPLEKHVAWFGDEDEMVSYNSMTDHLQQLGMTEDEAKHTANVVSLVGGTKISKCPYASFHASAAPKLKHPRDSNIFNEDGTLNEAAWEQLASYKETVNGVDVITEANLLKFIGVQQSSDTRWDWLGMGKVASNGEWRDYFKLFTDAYKGTGETAERCATVARLRQFFEDSSVVYEAAKRRELPVQRPS